MPVPPHASAADRVALKADVRRVIGVSRAGWQPCRTGLLVRRMAFRAATIPLRRAAFWDSRPGIPALRLQKNVKIHPFRRWTVWPGGNAAAQAVRERRRQRRLASAFAA